MRPPPNTEQRFALAPLILFLLAGYGLVALAGVFGWLDGPLLILLAIVWSLVACYRFISAPRALQDRAFTCAGFLATFFALAMLLIFLVTIGWEVVQWFYYVPQLVEKDNQATLRAREDLKKIEEIKSEDKKKIDEEYRQNLIKGELGEPRKDYLDALDQAALKADAVQLKNIARLKAELNGSGKAAEKFQQRLAAASANFRTAVSESAKDYKAQLKARADDFRRTLEISIKNQMEAVAAANDARDKKSLSLKLETMKALLAEISSAEEAHRPLIKNYGKTLGVLRDDKDLAKLALVKTLAEQWESSDGIFLNEPRLLEALGVAPNSRVAEKLQAIRAVQEEHDGTDGLYKTERRYKEALAAAPNDDVKEKLAVLKTLQESYEGPGGVYESQLRDLQITIAEKKAIADMPLRDTSRWGCLVHFLTSGPSNKPQDAGIYPALLGSLGVGLITIVFAVIVGVGAALYLEEYKHAGWLGKLIQININNLAGVPSVVFGILGAFIFVEMIFKPLEVHYPDSGIAARNLLGGGLTLFLLTLPVVIVSSQEAIRAVPVSIRQGAYALGATHWQVIWHNVIPMSFPGILTGSILSLSRAIGEAAPLVLFGALLFVNQEPSLFSRFTVLPMQIFGWADRPAETIDGESIEIWKYNAAMAIVVLMTVLLAMNALAIYFRNRAQKRMRY